MKDLFSFKLGLLLGALEEFLKRVEDAKILDGDVDKIKSLAADVNHALTEPTMIFKPSRRDDDSSPF